LPEHVQETQDAGNSVTRKRLSFSRELGKSRSKSSKNQLLDS
jgi:hypothetical protein